MSLKVRKIADDSLFNFSCAQWAMMEASDKANWEVIENTCGRVTLLSNPYAASQFFYTLDGQVAALDPLKISTVDGVSTILFKDQPAGTLLAGPVSGPDDYPTFRVLQVDDLPDITELVQDIIGPILTDTDTVNLTYNDATPSITADVRLQMSITSDVSGIKLSGDSESPGNNKVYGTDASGVKGWKDDPSGGGGGNYQTLRDGGVDATQRAAVNFVDTARISFTLTDDVGNNETEVTADIVDNSVTNAKFRTATAASVVGRSANTNGNVADIVSSTDHHVLRRESGGTLAWGLVGLDNLADGSVSLVKMANINTDRLLGRDTAGTGAVEEISLNATLSFTGAGAIQRAALTGDVTAAAGSNATTIANGVVTYAKIQNVTQNRILGRVSAGPGVCEELTPAQAQTVLGFLNGAAALTTPRIPYVSDADTLTDSANLRWLNGTKEIMVGDGASLDARYAHRESGTLGADTYYGYGLITTTNTYILKLENLRNQLNQGSTKLVLQVGGVSGGDPFVEYIIPGANNNWTHGPDNGDGDKFKITPKSTAPGSVANSGIIITSAAAALVGINLDAPTYPLDVGGRARSTQSLVTSANPTAGPLQAGMGTGGTVDFLLGTNNGFYLAFTVGTAPTANSDLFKITLNTAFPATYYPTFSQINKNAAQAINKIYLSNFDSGSLTLAVDGTLTAGAQYSFNFSFFGR